MSARLAARNLHFQVERLGRIRIVGGLDREARRSDRRGDGEHLFEVVDDPLESDESDFGKPVFPDNLSLLRPQCQLNERDWK